MSTPWKTPLEYIGRDPESRLLHRQTNKDVLFDIKAVPAQAARPLEYSWTAARIPHNSLVLDVGTGDSTYPENLIKLKNCSIVCVDLSPNRIHDIEYHCCNICQWKDNRRFNAITCISVLEHTTNDDVIVKNMVSRLVPFGLLLITTPYTHHEMQEDISHPSGLQRYYSMEAIHERIIGPSGCCLVDINFVHYGWPHGEPYFAPPHNAGVVLLALQKRGY